MPFRPEGIIKFREKLNMSRSDLAGTLGVGENTVYRWENSNAAPGAEHVGALLDLAIEKGVAPDFYESKKHIDPALIRIDSLFEAEATLEPDRILVVADSLRVPDRFG